MRVHPTVVHANGIVTVTVSATFVGDSTDADDQQRITAYGDPKINIAGLFTDPSNSNFSFTFPAEELWVGVTTALQNYSARFMTTLPLVPAPGSNLNPFAPTAQWNPFANTSSANASGQGPLDCVTTNPIEAATAWAAVLDARIQAAMTTLRAKTPAQLTSLPDATV